MKSRTRAQSGARVPAGPAPAWLAEALSTRWDSYCTRLKECRRHPSEEAVHELRVAIRRLMSQLWMTDHLLPDSAQPRAMRLLKTQFRGLGALRDTHVQRVFIDRQASRFPELEAMIRWLDRQERRQVRQAIRRIRRIKRRKLRRMVAARLRALSVRLSDPGAGRRFLQRALRLAGRAYDEAAGRHDRIDYARPATIHRTRVAFKKFRYLAEALPPAASGWTRMDLRRMAWHQRRMGRIQDGEVLMASVDRWLRRGEGSGETLAAFVRHLRRHQAAALRAFRRAAPALRTFRPRS